jgi:F-type H+-transporting ATPase subunit b
VAFAAKFLQRLAGPELDIKLAEVLMQDIETWPAGKIETLAKAVAEREGEITVTSASALIPSVQQSLEKKLSVKLGQKCKMNFLVDDTLITGLCLTVGPWVLQANAKDELAFFAGKPVHDN